MAHGMRQGRSGVPPRGTGNAEENDGAACTAGKAWQPMLWLSVKPKMPRTWLYVTNLCPTQISMEGGSAEGGGGGKKEL